MRSGPAFGVPRRAVPRRLLGCRSAPRSMPLSRGATNSSVDRWRSSRQPTLPSAGASSSVFATAGAPTRFENEDNDERRERAGERSPYDE